MGPAWFSTPDRSENDHDDSQSRPIDLVLPTELGPFATGTYLSGLPALRRSLRISATVAQLTITAYIVGAAGQLLLGPLSDA